MRIENVFKSLAVILVLLFAGYAYAEECVYTFTNISTISAGPTSCSGDCSSTNECRMNIIGAKEIFWEWMPSNILHSATDWDLEAWTSNAKTGQLRYYTDIATAEGGLATLGVGANTVITVTKSSNTVRYTYISGTDPGILATKPVPGSTIAISGFGTGNNGIFTVTASGSNYFEIYNPDGVAEATITPGASTITYGTNAAGSDALTSGARYVAPKISKNAGTAVYQTVVITVTK